MRHRTQDTYPLSHLLLSTGEHLERLAEGRVEIVTQNGEAVMVAMSPETYDRLRIELERGHIWDQAIARFDEGERGVDARELVNRLLDQLTSKE